MLYKSTVVEYIACPHHHQPHVLGNVMTQIHNFVADHRVKCQRSTTLARRTWTPSHTRWGYQRTGAHIPATYSARWQHTGTSCQADLKGPLDADNTRGRVIQCMTPRVGHRTHASMTGGSFEVIVCDATHSRAIRASHRGRRAAKCTQPKLRSTMVY